jgi:hypothetical protein
MEDGRYGDTFSPESNHEVEAFWTEYLALCKKHGMVMVPTCEGYISFHDRILIVSADDETLNDVSRLTSFRPEDWPVEGEYTSGGGGDVDDDTPVVDPAISDPPLLRSDTMRTRYELIPPDPLESQRLFEEEMRGMREISLSECHGIKWIGAWLLWHVGMWLFLGLICGPPKYRYKTWLQRWRSYWAH